MGKEPTRPASPPAPLPAPRRAMGGRAVGEMVGAVGGVAFRRFGFAQSQLIGRWREVVGPVYARWTAPEGLRFAHGQKTDGTLVVRVDGPFAVQMTHVAPQIIERANRVFGYAAVGRLKLVQGRVDNGAPAGEASRARPAAQAPSPPPSLRAVRDDALRDALAGLAAQVDATTGPPKLG